MIREQLLCCFPCVGFCMEKWDYIRNLSKLKFDMQMKFGYADKTDNKPCRKYKLGHMLLLKALGMCSVQVTWQYHVQQRTVLSSALVCLCLHCLRQ